MGVDSRHDLPLILTPRLVDLRSEFEAQLRAVERLDEQLRRRGSGTPAAARDFARALLRELNEMLMNNANIRGVLLDLAETAKLPT